MVIWIKWSLISHNLKCCLEAIHWMAEPLKLSTKSDLKKLVNAMEKLNKKVDKLSDRLPG